jgi:tRNA-Thr(GGU) m(6)t(6)A37 methyltransferase TsaA
MAIADPSIEIRPIGCVHRLSSTEDVTDRNLVSQIILLPELEPALAGIEQFSHLYVIYWLDRVSNEHRSVLTQPTNGIPRGVFAGRKPWRPNPIGLTLVELVRYEGNVLWVRGLDAIEDSPILDIKPYPEWVSGRLIVVTDFRLPPDWQGKP